MTRAAAVSRRAPAPIAVIRHPERVRSSAVQPALHRCGYGHDESGQEWGRGLEQPALVWSALAADTGCRVREERCQVPADRLAGTQERGQDGRQFRGAFGSNDGTTVSRTRSEDEKTSSEAASDVTDGAHVLIIIT